MNSPLEYVDSYKMSHKGFMEEGTEYIYSNMTPRSTKHLPVLKDRYDGKVVFFGLQAFILEHLIKEWEWSFFHRSKYLVISEFKELIDGYLGKDSVPMCHFEKLHDLGFLPIVIKALPEGSRVNPRVPFFTIQNTHPDFAWLTNYLETVISCELWKPCTTATIVAEYRKLVNDFAMETTGSLDGTQFQVHDFSHRGMSGRQDARVNGAAFLLSSCGSDTVPAISFLQKNYFANGDFIATSVPATEHSIACAGTACRGELESYRKWITEDYPTGIVSLVSDTYDYWKVLTEFLPALKEDILARPVNELGLSKVVIRPDSGDPVKIICGSAKIHNVRDSVNDIENWAEDCLGHYATEDTAHGEPGPEYVQCYLRWKGKIYKATGEPCWNRYDRQHYYLDGMDNVQVVEHELSAEEKGSVELLWETFGGTITEQGYKVLDSHIGLIYGDSITLPRALAILEGLKAKGFASTNIVFGVGSYTMQYVTRDSAGIAIKATWAQVNGVGYDLYKDPITDDGTKKSAKGLLRVEKEGDDFVLYDQQTREQEGQGALEVVFKDGELKRRQSLSEIRSILWPR